jgi:hypothetical protein
VGALLELLFSFLETVSLFPRRLRRKIARALSRHPGAEDE